MRPPLYQEVVLTRDFPDEGLRARDVAMLVDYVEGPRGVGEGAILEVFNALGSIRVAIVPSDCIEALREDEVPSVRLLEEAG